MRSTICKTAISTQDYTREKGIEVLSILAHNDVPVYKTTAFGRRNTFSSSYFALIEHDPQAEFVGLNDASGYSQILSINEFIKKFSNPIDYI